MNEQVRQVDVAAVGALFGDPARVAMLTALADGRALPAGELARAAGVSAATATAHLRRLVEAGLVRVRAQGRHRYHEISWPQVANVLEALARIAPTRPVRSLRQHREALALAQARTCYDHLAGRFGVELRERLLDAGVLRPVDDRDHRLTRHGEGVLTGLGIDVTALRASRRVQARSCLDWTERRSHLAGAVPAAITSALLRRGWLTRTAGRGLRARATYQTDLDELLADSPLPVERSPRRSTGDGSTGNRRVRCRWGTGPSSVRIELRRPSRYETATMRWRRCRWTNCPTPTPPRTTWSCGCTPRDSRPGSWPGRPPGPTGPAVTGRRACPGTRCRVWWSSWGTARPG